MLHVHIQLCAQDFKTYNTSEAVVSEVCSWTSDGFFVCCHIRSSGAGLERFNWFECVAYLYAQYKLIYSGVEKVCTWTIISLHLHGDLRLWDLKTKKLEDPKIEGHKTKSWDQAYERIFPHLASANVAVAPE